MRRTASLCSYLRIGMVKCMGGCWVFPAAACELLVRDFASAYCIRSRALVPHHKSITCAYLCVMCTCACPLANDIHLSQNFKIDMLMVLINKINRYPSEQRTHYY